MLLLAPASMPQAAVWRRAIARHAGRCTLATLHPAVKAAEPTESVVPLGGWLTAPSRVRALWERGGYDVAFAYYLTSYGLLAALSIPGAYVAVAAGSDLFPQRWKAARRGAASLALRRALGCLAWTPVMRDAMVGLGARPDRILVGPRGVELTTFAGQATPRRPGSPLQVITTRRLRPLFRHEVLIEAASLALAGGADLTVTFVGDGTSRDSLEALVDARDMSGRTRFTGSLDAAGVVAELTRAQVFVSLSRSDGLSTSLIEAMVCGLVPVVSDIAANRELVEHGRTGWLVRGDDPKELAATLSRLAADPALCETVRARNLSESRDRFDVDANTAAALRQAAAWVAAR